eukprot:scaffold23186_cov112-Isochrysis_galbana.AAC.13
MPSGKRDRLGMISNYKMSKRERGEVEKILAATCSLTPLTTHDHGCSSDISLQKRWTPSETARVPSRTSCMVDMAPTTPTPIATTEISPRYRDADHQRQEEHDDTMIDCLWKDAH